MPQKRFQGRIPVKKAAVSSNYRADAKKAYGTVKNVGGKRQPHKTTAQSVLDAAHVGAFDALKELEAFGFLSGAKKRCVSCGAGLGKPEEWQYPGKLYLRCTSWKCQKRRNVTYFSCFPGTRLSLVDLCRVVTFYSRSRLMDAPRVRDCQAQLLLPRTAVAHVYQSLLATEARAGKALCAVKTGPRRLTANIEADARGVRKFYVGHTNPHFQREVLEAAQRFRKANPGAALPKYWQAHFRVIGLKARTFSGNVAKRGGALVLRPLCFKLVVGAASPPVESKAEILASGILHALGNPATSACTAMVPRLGKASAKIAKFGILQSCTASTSSPRHLEAPKSLLRR